MTSFICDYKCIKKANVWSTPRTRNVLSPCKKTLVDRFNFKTKVVDNILDLPTSRAQFFYEREARAEDFFMSSEMRSEGL